MKQGPGLDLSETEPEPEADTHADAGADTSFTPPAPNPAGARMFAAQKRRLMAEMFGVEPSEPSGSDALGTIGHYELLGVLGDGGMGRVYEALDTSLERKVALKTLLAHPNDATARLRLIREAKSMARLNHRNVVQVYEIGDGARGPYIVMEFIEGQTLRGWLARRERTLTEILEVFRVVGRALAAIHEAGFTHRDLKPDNVMIDHEGRVVVMDLGIARFQTEQPSSGAQHGDAPGLTTRTGALLGTPFYMAPEQFAGGEVDDKSDQYSFCVSLWEAVYRERPIEAATLSTLALAVCKGQRREPTSPERAPSWLRKVLERGMSVEADERFESMDALVEALEPPGDQQRWKWFAVLGAGVAALGVGAWLESNSPPDTAQIDAPAPTPTAPEPGFAPDPPADTVRTLAPVHAFFALLAEDHGLAYIDDGALWVRDLEGSTPPRQLFEGKVYKQLQVTRSGDLYFNVAGSGEESPHVLHRASPPYTSTAVVGELLAPDFCVLERQGKVVSTRQNARGFALYTRDPSGLSADYSWIELEPDFRWIMGLSCDDVHDRVAVLQEMDSVEHQLALIDLGNPEESVEIALPSAKVRSPRVSLDGEHIYYLIDHGRGLELEGRAIANEAARPFTPFAPPEPGEHTVAYALGPNESVVRLQSHGPRTRIERWPHGPSRPDEPSWRFELPTSVSAMALSPDEQTLAYAERGGQPGLRRVELGSSSPVPTHLRSVANVRDLAWSPDGTTLAFVALHLGKAQVWTLSAEGEEPKLFEDTTSASNADIAWAPSPAILYQPPGVREYKLLDPESERERPLFDPKTLQGWVFGALPSPDGSRVALQWNRPGCGLSLVDVEDGSETILSETDWRPIGWSSDGRDLYVTTDRSPDQVSRLPVTGGEPQAWFELDLDEDGAETFAGCSAVFRNGDVLCHTTTLQIRMIWSVLEPAAAQP